MIVTGRIAAKWQTVTIKFTQEAKNQHFHPTVATRFKWNLAWPKGMWVCLALRNFTQIGAWGWVHSPKSRKFPLVNICPTRANP